MQRVQVWAQLSDETHHAYECEARRRGVTIETLVEQTVNCLLEELERESEPLPSYVLNFRTVLTPFGPEEFRAACEEQRVVADLAKERRRLEE